MKNLCPKLLVILFLSLCVLVSAKPKTSEAAHLQAFYLTGELMDYANRVESARAYLMAAELMLEHPVSPLKEKVQERLEKREVRILKATGRPEPLALVNRARELADFAAPGIKDWASEIAERAKQQVRASTSDYASGSLTISESTEHILRPVFRPGRVSRVVARTGDGVTPLNIRVTARNGVVIAEGASDVSFRVQRERKLLVTISSKSSKKTDYELMIR